MKRKSKPPIALYSALADATRCRIVEILLAGPIPVHQLAGAFSVSRPAISRHLRVLKTAGLVAEVKKGRENLYALRPARLSAAVAWIDSIVSPELTVVPDEPPAPVASDIAMAEKADPAPAENRTAPAEVTDRVAEPSAPTPGPRARRTEKADKAPKLVRPEPAVDQMGFDF